MNETLLGYTIADIKEIIYTYACCIFEDSIWDGGIEDCIPKKYWNDSHHFMSDEEETKMTNDVIIKTFEANDEETIKNIIEYIFVHSFGYTEWIDSDDEMEDLTDLEIIDYINNFFKEIGTEKGSMFELIGNLNDYPFKKEIIKKIRDNADEY